MDVVDSTIFSVTPPAASTPNSPYTPAPVMTTAVTPPGQSEQSQLLNISITVFLLLFFL